jgi:hypothetical protein
VNGIIQIPAPINDPNKTYAPGSPERASLKKRLDEMLKEVVDIPAIIGGKEVRTGKTLDVVCPHDHKHKLGVAHQVSEKEVQQAIEASRKAWIDWSETGWEARAAVVLKAAELIAGPWRDTLNASTMLGQSKTAFQAEIDAAWRSWTSRFNRAHRKKRPADLSRGIWNYVEHGRLLRSLPPITDRRESPARCKRRRIAGVDGDPVELLHHEGAAGRGLPDGVINCAWRACPVASPDRGPALHRIGLTPSNYGA